MKPFSEGDSVTFKNGDLTVESSDNQLSFMSDFNIRRDQKGLAFARELQSLLNATVQRLEVDEKNGKLPEVLAEGHTTMQPNPLA